MKDLSTREKPVKITTSSIGKSIKQLTLIEKNADKLPRTMAYIDSVKESVTDFQKRRINWSVKHLKDEELEFWKIVRKAGIRESFYLDLDEEIMTLLNHQHE
ncbi:hypothetical protein [Lysinibacillus fusiformis]|uniref:hypothetical protein n=1 Tax=Lysinibacillus fusiformis TaxID=28031 RepID=UPI0016434775|nr:hypothetical protein [Lysinibacillus fusiformis]